MTKDEDQSPSKTKHAISDRKVRLVKTNSQVSIRSARALLRRISSRSWTGSTDRFEEHYTIVEMLTLCLAIIVALSLLSLPIIFHHVEVERDTDSKVIPASGDMEDYQQDGSAEDEQFIVQASVADNLTCSEGFYVASNICVPACDQWEQDSHQTTVVDLSVLLVAALMSLVSGVCVIIGSIIRRDSMLQFPSVLVVYMTIAHCLYNTIRAISLIDSLTSRTLFCTSRNLLDTFNQSTTFCTIHGAVMQYFGVNIVLWWLFHIAWIWYKLNFALLSKVKLNITCVHIILIILGILLPLPAVVVALSHEDYHYTMAQTPAPFCISKDHMFTYYSLFFIVNIMMMAGVSMLLPILWTVHKYRRKKETQLTFYTPEIKLMFVFCYYTFLGVTSVSYYSFYSANANLLSSSLQDYFGCESTGLPNNCSSSMYAQHMYPQLLVMSGVLFSFIPTVNLIYVINWRKAKQVLLHPLGNFHGRNSQRNLSVRQAPCTTTPAAVTNGCHMTSLI